MLVHQTHKICTNSLQIALLAFSCYVQRFVLNVSLSMCMCSSLSICDDRENKILNYKPKILCIAMHCYVYLYALLCVMNPLHML